MTGLIRAAKAENGTIAINADGSISPSSAPIYTADNITYTLTGNITAATDGIVIERNNIVLNGAGYTVSGSGSGDGITLTNISNVTINNMIIKNFGWGVYLWSPFDCTLSGNTVTANNDNGIMLNNSPGNTLFGNNTLSGNNVVNDGYGIFLYASSNCTLSGNTVTANNAESIYLQSSSDCTLSGNTVANNEFGIYLYSSCDNNTLSGNNVKANKYDGITLDSSCDHNTLSGNTVTANNGYGIVLTNSSGNTIFYNNFVSNKDQTYTDGLANKWDNGSVGNYWSDYMARYPNAVQVDSSGVWNTPYVIDANNTDHYPLMVSYVIPEFPSFLVLALFLIATLLTVAIYKKKAMSQKRLHSS
jgi:parallel beta-helix repeat protein